MTKYVRTPAARRLAEVLCPPPPKWTRQTLARRLRVSEQAVGNWIRGNARPDMEKRVQLNALLGIPMKSWLHPSERRQ